MRAFGRDLIRGGHYGQRSCEPHLKAEHMAAPTNAAYVKKALGCTDQCCLREESSCQLGAVHTWHFATRSDVVHLRPLSRRTGYSCATGGHAAATWLKLRRTSLLTRLEQKLLEQPAQL